ncbi:MAG: GDP-mannose dehydrogenase, partial [Pseudomonadota bacterium]
MNQDEPQVSLSPEGEVFPLPGEAEYAAENQRLAGLVADQRALGREIVVVMGVGFVGAVMAAVVADSVGEDGQPGKFVIGMQRPST